MGGFILIQKLKILGMLKLIFQKDSQIPITSGYTSTCMCIYNLTAAGFYFFFS